MVNLSNDTSYEQVYKYHDIHFWYIDILPIPW
jgi:hypothetical protein